MSKETEAAAAAPPPESLIVALRRLHREYVASVRELAADGERRVNAALEGCMAEMARIEDDAAVSIRKASTECETALRAASAEGTGATSTHYWDYQRKVAEATTAAGARAEPARKSYLDAWRATADSLESARRKARLDYLARIQQAWRTLDVEKVDATTAEVLVQAFDSLFADVAVR